MYKNQLQELAQRSCFNLPSYTCHREGPDHAPRFKATVVFNGESFHSPQFFSTLRQAEHAAAEVALNSLSSNSVATARILDETGVYKNLLQEIAQRVGSPLPQYTTFRSGLGHHPVFTGIVELADIIFTGEHAKNKKQAEKNAALAAWTSLKQLAQQDSGSSSETENSDELEQIKIARALLNYRMKKRMGISNASTLPMDRKFQFQNPRLSSTSSRPRPVTGSKLLPLICPKTAYRARATSPSPNEGPSQLRPQKFPAPGAVPYFPIRHCGPGMAPAVTVRSVVPVFAAPPVRNSQPMPPHQPVRMAPPVTIRQAIPVFAAPIQKEQSKPVDALAFPHQQPANLFESKPVLTTLPESPAWPHQQPTNLSESKPVFVTLPVQREEQKLAEALALPHQQPANLSDPKPVLVTLPVQKEEPNSAEAPSLPHEQSAKPDETQGVDGDDLSGESEVAKLLDELEI